MAMFLAEDCGSLPRFWDAPKCGQVMQIILHCGRLKRTERRLRLGPKLRRELIWPNVKYRTG